MTTYTDLGYFLQTRSANEAPALLEALNLRPFEHWRRVSDLPDGMLYPEQCEEHIGSFMVLSDRNYPNSHIIAPAQ